MGECVSDTGGLSLKLQRALVHFYFSVRFWMEVSKALVLSEVRSLENVLQINILRKLKRILEIDLKVQGSGKCKF